MEEHSAGRSSRVTISASTTTYSRDAPSWCFRLGEARFSIEDITSAPEIPLCVASRRKEDTLSHDRSFITATYADLSQADGDYATIRRLYAELGVPLEFDAVIIGHKASGEARFYSSDRDECRPDADEPATWSLAAGLAAGAVPVGGRRCPAQPGGAAGRARRSRRGGRPRARASRPDGARFTCG